MTSLTLDTAFVGTTARGATGDFAPCAGVMRGDNGVTYLAVQWAGATNCTKVINLETGTVIAEIDGPGELTSVAGQGTYTFGSRCSGGAVGDGRHCFALGQDLTGGLSSRWGVGFWYVNSSGVLTANGYYLGRSNSLGANDRIDATTVFAAGMVGSNFVMIGTSSGSLITVPVTGPGLSTNENTASPYPWDERCQSQENASVIEGAIRSHASYRPHFGALFFANGALYHYMGRADAQYEIDTGGSPAPIDLIASSYPSGAIIKFTSAVESGGSPSGTHPVFNITGYAVDNANWPSTPFSDAGKDKDGNEDDNDDYFPSAFVHQQDNGNDVIVFSKAYEDSDDRNPTGTYWRFKVYLRKGNNFSLVADQEGSIYDTVDDLGVPSASRYALTNIAWGTVWGSDNTLYCWHQEQSGSPSPATNTYVFAKVGLLTVTGGYVVLNVN